MKHTKHTKVFSLLLCAFLLASLLPAGLPTARAADRGTITFSAGSDGVLTQEMVTERLAAAGVEYGVTFSAVFDTSVTVIGDGAFDGTSLTSAVIPDSVATIRSNAFLHCRLLAEFSVSAGNPYFTSIDGVLFSKNKTALLRYPGAKSGEYTIPDSVMTIWDNAFFYCENLVNIVLPDSVVNVGYNVFWNCMALKSVSIPDSVVNIRNNIFVFCISLERIDVSPDNQYYASIDGVLFDKDKTTIIQYPSGKTGGYTIPDSVTTIGDRAFSNCALTDIRIPGSVTRIEEYAFRSCAELTSVSIPDSVTYIGSEAFLFGSLLARIDVSADNLYYSSLDGILFDKSMTTLIQCPGGKTGECIIPDSVTAIGYNAFYFCEKLTGVVIGNGIKVIGDSAFSHCDSLTNAVIPDSVIEIGNYAFSNCTSLVNIVIPDSVTTIGNSAFEYCVKLAEVRFLGVAPESVGSGVFDRIPTNTVIHIWDGAMGFTADENGKWNGLTVVRSPRPSYWAQDNINNALSLGLIPASLQKRQYDAPATRAEFCDLAVTLYEKMKGEITTLAKFLDTNNINVRKMAGIGVVTGRGDGTFDPDGTITREGSAVLVYKLLVEMGVVLPDAETTFVDAESFSDWATLRVGAVQAAGIMSGIGDNTFNPQGIFSREESMITMKKLYEMLTIEGE